MKLLFRVIIISLLYYCINLLELFDFILDIRIFTPILIIIFIFAIFSFFLDKNRIQLFKIIISSIFTILFTIQTIHVFFLMYNDGDASLGWIIILSYLSMYALSVNWLIEDAKIIFSKYLKMKK